MSTGDLGKALASIMQWGFRTDHTPEYSITLNEDMYIGAPSFPDMTPQTTGSPRQNGSPLQKLVDVGVILLPSIRTSKGRRFKG